MKEETDKLYAKFGQLVYRYLTDGTPCSLDWLSEKAQLFSRELIGQRARFKKHQQVYILEPAAIVRAKVTDIEYNPGADTFRYQLFELTGRRLGWFPESELFETKEQLIDFYVKKVLV